MELNSATGQIDYKDCQTYLHLQKKLEPSQTDEYRCGRLCPNCRAGVLDYDGMLNLVCPQCGSVQGGCFT